MTRISITIRGQHDRDRLAELANTLAVGMRVDIKSERRSSEQNSRFWAMLGDIADQLPWHGIKLSATDYKYLFMESLHREIRIIPNLDGNGFVNLGRSSADLSVSEMSDLMELMAAFGANHNVKFHELDSADVNPPGRLDAPAGDPIPLSPTPAGATDSDSSGGHRQADLTDAPAAVPPTPATPAAAGAHHFEEASLLSDDWRDVYVQSLAGVRDKAASLHTRHAEAMQMIGGQPNEAELAWMRKVWRLVQRRNESKLRRGEYDAEVGRLKTLPLWVVTA